MSSDVITPGPYRATKLWNEVTRLFRAGMPLRKHRQNLRHHASCFTAAAAVDWLHQLLRSNSNFGPDVSRQQTVQLLKKFLKNHVIEDVKGRWGSEELEDNNALYRFPSTSPLKPLPHPAPPAPKAVKKRPSLRDKDGLFRFRGTKRADKDVEENLDGVPLEEGAGPQVSAPPRRELTVEDEQEVWRDITLTHLQRILGVSSLEDVLDHRHVNAQNIIHNMTKVNKHGVVTLDDKNGDLPHWVLSAMKSLANWPKYDSSQPSYPGFERDVFRTVSDYFLSLPQPLLTYELYELFINVLVYCGYVTTPSSTHQRGKRKQAEGLRGPPAKTSFRSTECLLLSLLRRGSCDEAESPMREVLGGRPEWRLAALRGGGASTGAPFGGSCSSLSTLGTERPRTRSCSLETVLDDSAPLTRQQLFRSSESLASCIHSNQSLDDDPGVTASRRQRCLRPRSVGSRLDVVAEEDGREAWCSPTAAASRPLAFFPSSSAAASHSSSSSLSAAAHRRGALHGAATSSAHVLRTAIRRCHSAMDVSTLPPPVCTQPPQPEPEHSLLQPQCERMAIEALQLCTLLLPPVSRRKLQLLMRMMARISQNVDMPRLHAAIATRTLMVHTFSTCILGSAGECDLDELLATRLVSFLLDHQQNILSVPDYLLSAINDHVSYLRTVQVPVESTSDCCGQAGPPIPMYAFCRQISGAEFEQQKLAASQKAMEELLEMLLTDQNLSEKDRRRKLKQFQKQYPDIYRRRLPVTDGGSADNKPKIKAPLLSIKKSKAFSIRT